MFGTLNLEIPDLAVKEVKLLFHHKIASWLRCHPFLPSLFMNFDKKPLNLALGSSNFLAKKESKHVTIVGGSFKKSITATSGVTYPNKFPPMMLIYKEKTPKCFPRVDFLTWILLSANEKHFSNTQESLKLLDEIIVPYMKKKRDLLQVRHDYSALFIIDIFRGK